MSDFASMAYDAAYDQYIAGIVCDKVMKNATLQQCIYLFVEGRTEEVAYPELLAKCDLDTDELGIVVANYGGASNLIHCLRLLKKTLSHDRPVVATIDNDEKGRDTLTKLERLDFDMNLVSIFPLPKIDPPLRYPDGNRGGSFEELFSCQLFVNQAFSPDFMPDEIVAAKDDFLNEFDKTSSWFNQVQKFCALRGYCNFKDSKNKVQLGERLAIKCKEPPQDICKLADVIRDIREKHPIRHPEAVAAEVLRGVKDNSKRSG